MGSIAAERAAAGSAAHTTTDTNNQGEVVLGYGLHGMRPAHREVSASKLPIEAGTVPDSMLLCTFLRWRRAAAALMLASDMRTAHDLHTV